MTEHSRARSLGKQGHIHRFCGADVRLGPIRILRQHARNNTRGAWAWRKGAHGMRTRVSGTSTNMAYTLRAVCMYLMFCMMRASRRVRILAFLFHALACAPSAHRHAVRRALAPHLRHCSCPRIAPGIQRHDGVGVGGAGQVGVLVLVRRASRRQRTRRHAALRSPAFVGRCPARCGCACDARVRCVPSVGAHGRVVAAVCCDVAGVAAL